VVLSASLDLGDGFESGVGWRASSPEKTFGSNASVREWEKSVKESPLLVGEVSMKNEVGLKGFPFAALVGKSFKAASILEVVGVFNPKSPCVRSKLGKVS